MALAELQLYQGSMRSEQALARSPARLEQPTMMECVKELDGTLTAPLLNLQGKL